MSSQSRISPQSRLLHVLFTLMLFVGILQILMFHTQTTVTDGRLHIKVTMSDEGKVYSTVDRAMFGNVLQFSSNAKPSTNHNQNRTDVIVYLAQFSQFHTSYGLQKDANKASITGLSKLNKSLELLYSNYVNEFDECDVLIFYTESGPDNETIRELSRGRPQLQFRELKGKWWSLPHGLKPVQRFKWNRPAFR